MSFLRNLKILILFIIIIDIETNQKVTRKNGEKFFFLISSHNQFDEIDKPHV
jgi:hypothetical protein